MTWHAVTNVLTRLDLHHEFSTLRLCTWENVISILLTHSSTVKPLTFTRIVLIYTRLCSWFRGHHFVDDVYVVSIRCPPERIIIYCAAAKEDDIILSTRSIRANVTGLFPILKIMKCVRRSSYVAVIHTV